LASGTWRSIVHFCDALAEVLLPAFRERGNLQGATDGGRVSFAEPFGDVKAGDFGNWDRVGIPGKGFDFVTGGDLAFAGDG
jgi:hypothetical protein